MPTKALLDSNVFLFGFERKRSNSHRILEKLAAGEIRGVVTDRIVRETLGYLRRHYSKDVVGRFRDFMLLTCELVLEAEVRMDAEQVDAVGIKDAGAPAAVRSLGLARFVSTDSDFAKVPEWRPPSDFIRELGERPAPGDEWSFSGDLGAPRGGSRAAPAS